METAVVSRYVGEKGKRMSAVLIPVKSSRFNFTNRYRKGFHTTEVHSRIAFVDSHGRELVSFASSRDWIKKFEENIGKSLKCTFTVKSHDEYMGHFYTNITRVVFD